MDVMHTRCAGLDVHKKTVVACRMRTGETGEGDHDTQTFGTKTGELLGLVDWLTEWEVSHVAMESTGDYWKPIYNLVEGNVEVLLVNARHVKNVPGRKTDVKDAEWLAELLRHGLLRSRFIPPQVQRDLRDLTRYRTRVGRERTRLVREHSSKVGNIILGHKRIDMCTRIDYTSPEMKWKPTKTSGGHHHVCQFECYKH